jgi:hypothetical protein
VLLKFGCSPGIGEPFDSAIGATYYKDWHRICSIVVRKQTANIASAMAVIIKKRIAMKRCALIISDNHQFREWLGCHVTIRWPKMMIEYARTANGPMYLDRARLDRYRLIVVRQGLHSIAELTTCIFLLRILNLESRPEIIFIAEDAEQLKAAKSTRLGELHCLLASEVTSAKIQAILDKIAHRDLKDAGNLAEGAPDIPGYTIRQPIAGTYSSTVYRAFSTDHGKDVALKICELNTFGDNEYHRLTLREEYKILKELNGRYVPNVYDYGEKDGLSYMAMEYLPHGTIKKLFANSGRSICRVEYMLHVAEALREIHNAGVLHLDLKPNNVLIREDGTPALIDFGISKRIDAARSQEKAGFSMGSPYFMSPEQIRGGPLDERSDLYSFGVLWYRIFTGRTPFRGRTIEEISAAREYGSAPSMGYALRHYQPIVDRTLVNSPEDRFATAQELIDHIKLYSIEATGSYHALHLTGTEARSSQGPADWPYVHQGLSIEDG